MRGSPWTAPRVPAEGAGRARSGGRGGRQTEPFDPAKIATLRDCLTWLWLCVRERFGFARGYRGKVMDWLSTLPMLAAPAAPPPSRPTRESPAEKGRRSRKVRKDALLIFALRLYVRCLAARRG